MPDDMAQEKVDVLTTLGAEVHRVPSVSIVNRGHFCRVAEEKARNTPNAVYVDQFETLANYRAHFEGTGVEIWEQTGGRLDAFVMAAGTGGTLAGVGAALRTRDPRIRVGLIDPPGSALYNKVGGGE
jgi:cysteine synthase A